MTISVDRRQKSGSVVEAVATGTGETSQTTRLASTRSWFAVAAVGLSTFCVVTTEMSPVGLLTPIADSLNVSAGTGGLMLSIPAVLAAFFAPIVVLGAGRTDRRMILCGLLALLVCANLASAFAPSIGWLLAARVLVGFCMGGIWALAGGLAVRLAPPGSVGLATAIIFGGVAAASVLGVPLGAFIGGLAGWRAAFGAMAVLSGIVLVITAASLPALPAASSASIRTFGVQLLERRVQLGLLTTFFLVAGHFMAFTFVRPLLQSVSGYGEDWVGPLLFAYGVAGVAGNFIAGMISSRQVGWTLLTITLALGSTLALFPLFATTNVGGATLLLVWGVAYGGVSVSLQTWIMKSAPHAIETATSLFVAVFNLGIAVGSFLGGPIVDGHGLETNMTVSSGMILAALALAAFIQREISRSSQPGATADRRLGR